MICTKKINIGSRKVPCGQCMACRINKQRVWASRILQEQATNPFRCWFLTLTYADDTVPKTVEGRPTLKKSDLLNYVRKIRKNGIPFRYFACGEYGDLTERPHYHMAVFPTDLQHHTAYTKTWTQGFTTTREMLPSRAQYIASYTVKKLNKTMVGILDGREPEFAIMSRYPGLGHAMAHKIAKTYQTKNGARLLAEQGDVEKTIRIDGRIWPIGNYGVGKIRYQLGIPETRADRLLLNPNLDHYFPLEIDDDETITDHQTSQARLKRGEKKKRINTQTV